MSEFRKDLKKVPSFRRNVLQRKVPLSWRKPKGLFNKRKDGSKSKGKNVKIGYGQDRRYRSLVPSIDYKNGQTTNYQKAVLKVKLIIKNLKDISELILKENQCVILSRELGLRKRTLIIKECLNKNIKIFPFQLRKIDQSKRKNEKK